MSQKRWRVTVFPGNFNGCLFHFGTRWHSDELEQEGIESIGNVLVTMINYFSGDGTIVAATHGNGMYSANLSDVWQTEINIADEPLAFGDAYPNPFVETTIFPLRCLGMVW